MIPIMLDLSRAVEVEDGFTLHYYATELIFVRDANDAEKVFSSVWDTCTPQERKKLSELSRRSLSLFSSHRRDTEPPVEFPSCVEYMPSVVVVKMNIEQFFYYVPPLLAALRYPVRICEYCSRPFIPRRPNQTRFCSSRCGRSYHAILSRKRKKEKDGGKDEHK